MTSQSEESARMEPHGGDIMREWQSLSHVKWESKYHATIAPKYQWKVIFSLTRRKLGKIIFNYANNKMESNWLKVMQRGINIHLILSVPPKGSIAMLTRHLRGTSATHIHRQYLGSLLQFKITDQVSSRFCW